MHNYTHNICITLFRLQEAVLMQDTQSAVQDPYAGLKTATVIVPATVLVTVAMI